ncbi:MAG: phage portal protein [Desulfitobacterium hafniense]
MSDLQDFFAQNTDSSITEEVIISERFKNKEGKPIPWVLRNLTEAENEEHRKAATKRVKGKGGASQTETDTNDYMAKLAVASVVFPDLKNAELQKSYGVMGGEDLLRKMLFPGEYAKLLKVIQEINGFDQAMEDLIEEVKN